MAIDRHQARILAMQALCQLDVQGEGFMVHVPAFLADADADGPTRDYAQRLVETAWRGRAVTAAELTRRVPDWSVERLTPVDRNTIRTALAEFDLGQVPPKVIINEAVEIGREYGSAESPGFINAILDGIWKGQDGAVAKDDPGP